MTREIPHESAPPAFTAETMASARQQAAARRNIKKAAAAAKRKRTVAALPKKTRKALGKGRRESSEAQARFA